MSYCILQFHGLRIQGLRVGNTEIPNDKRLETSLQHVYGIGRSRAHQILCDLNIGNKLTKELTGVELNSLREEVSRYLTGEDLVAFSSTCLCYIFRFFFSYSNLLLPCFRGDALKMM